MLPVVAVAAMLAVAAAHAGGSLHDRSRAQMAADAAALAGARDGPAAAARLAAANGARMTSYRVVGDDVVVHVAVGDVTAVARATDGP